MNKTKKITSLLLAFTLVFAFFTTSALADSSDHGASPDGIYHLTMNNSTWDMDYYLAEGFDKNVTLIINDGTIKAFFKKDGVQYESFTSAYEDDRVNGEGYLFKISESSEGFTNYIDYVDFREGGIITSIYHEVGIFKTGYSYIKEELPTESQAIETSFMDKVVTDSGQYEMYVSGFVNVNVVNGENVLTSADIAKQNISIHTKNTVTGEIRVMTQSTIEGMTLNVSGGTVTSITLKGRVQTSKGTLERYTTTVNL